MTWEEFIKAVEAKGVKPGDQIRFIDFSGFDPSVERKQMKEDPDQFQVSVS